MDKEELTIFKILGSFYYGAINPTQLMETTGFPKKTFYRHWKTIRDKELIISTTDAQHNVVFRLSTKGKQEYERLRLSFYEFVVSPKLNSEAQNILTSLYEQYGNSWIPANAINGDDVSLISINFPKVVECKFKINKEGYKKMVNKNK